MKKRLTGLLILALLAGLFLFGATASADMLTANGMTDDVRLATGSTVTITVDMKDLSGSRFENFLLDLRYDSEILGNPKIVKTSKPKTWTLYKGLLGDGRVTAFVADETAQKSVAKTKFTMAIQFTVIGVAAKDTPFKITLDVSGAALSNGVYVPRTASDAISLTLQGGMAVGTVFSDSKGNNYMVTGSKTAAFYKAAKLETVTVPATVTKGGLTFTVNEISDKAFYKNTTVKKAVIGKKVTTIGKQAFAAATALTNVTGCASVITIEDDAFKGCKALKSYAFGRKLKTLSAGAFSGCVKLAKCTLFERVAFIGADAFYNCKALKTLTIHTTEVQDLGAVGKNAFANTYKKMKITVYAPSSSVFDAIKDVLTARGISEKAVWTENLE